MSDDKSKKAPEDASRIALEEDYEVRYWTKALDVSEERLRQLVKDHGNSVEAVMSALGR